MSTFKYTVAALAALTLLAPPAPAGEDVDALLQSLQSATAEEAPAIERRIKAEWSKSGSASMDLLLRRGRDAMERGDLDAALGHFTALTDHAPDFAEGWHGRALVLFRMDRLGPALADLEQTLRLNPHHFGAIRGLGAIFERLDAPDMAYRAYTQALAVNPHDAEVKDALERLRPGIEGTQL